MVGTETASETKTAIVTGMVVVAAAADETMTTGRENATTKVMGMTIREAKEGINQVLVTASTAVRDKAPNGLLVGASLCLRPSQLPLLFSASRMSFTTKGKLSTVCWWVLTSPSSSSSSTWLESTVSPLSTSQLRVRKVFAAAAAAAEYAYEPACPPRLTSPTNQPTNLLSKTITLPALNLSPC